MTIFIFVIEKALAHLKPPREKKTGNARFYTIERIERLSVLPLGRHN